MRNHYWTCSRFADWLRGTSKPKAETGSGWARWKREAKDRHPFRYWLADDGLDYLQNFFYWPTDKIYAIKYYINNRWVTKTHALTAHSNDIPRGEWRDVGYRFLPCLFNELRDYVEVELAWWHLAWADKEDRAKYNAPWWRFGWWNVRVWRSAAAGLDNLAWQMALTNKDYIEEGHPDYGKPSPQAVNAKEIYDLYKWWTEERPKRPDPYEVSGWSAYCEHKRENGGLFFNEDEDNPDVEKIDTSPMLDKIRELEEQFEKEDEEMMIRLIKIRQSLWT